MPERRIVALGGGGFSMDPDNPLLDGYILGVAEAVDVVIIGGGIAGASAAYVLARLGVRDVLVLERSAVAAGASGRATGLVSFLATAHRGQAALLKASAGFYAAWEARIGGPPAVTPAGALLPVGPAGLPALARARWPSCATPATTRASSRATSWRPSSPAGVSTMSRRRRIPPVPATLTHRG